MGIQASTFQFSRPVLNNITFATNDDFSPPDDGIALQIQTKTTVTRTNKCNAKVFLNMTIGAENAPFTIDVEMLSEFLWSDELEEEEIAEFLRMNAPALLISYIRPIVADLTSMSRFQTYHIPFMDMSTNAIEE